MPVLEEEVNQVLQACGLFPKDPLLLACSGGRDSMVLLHVLLELNYRPAVAHVNFKLRGEDSMADVAFVSDFCAGKDLQFFTREFDTSIEAEKTKESIQMAARRLRYDWLFGLMEEFNYSRVLTAHHDRDQAETLLLNLMRGTGARGLQGMTVDSGRLLRPMLRSEYTEISRYADKKGVLFREDRSNSDTKYKRNFIRHKLIQPWEERYPGSIRQINRSSEYMEEVNRFLEDQLDKESREFVSINGDTCFISYEIGQRDSAPLLMRHVLKDFDMEDQAPFILEAHSRPGAIFSSHTHELLADRKHWIVRPLHKESGKFVSGFMDPGDPEQVSVSIPTNRSEIRIPFGEYQFTLRSFQKGESWPLDNSAILLSETILQQGLYFRSWQKGDRIHPFGFHGTKKVSDLFIDMGIDRFQKEYIPILCNKKGELLWVAGIRSSELLRLASLAEADWVLEV